MFHSFLSDDSKQDSATTTVQSKRTIILLNQSNIIFNTLITIWGETDGFDEHYIFETALYLISMLSQAFSVIIDLDISAPGHGREVVDGLNAIDKSFLFPLMSTVQLTGSKGYDTQMVNHTGIRTSNVNLASEFLKHLSKAAHKHGIIDQGKYKNRQVKKLDRKVILCSE